MVPSCHRATEITVPTRPSTRAWNRQLPQEISLPLIVKFAPCGCVITVGLRAARSVPGRRFGEVLIAIRNRYHAAVGDAEYLTLAQIDHREEPFDGPAPHVRRGAAQVVAADLDDAFAGVLGNGEIPGCHRRAEDFVWIGHAAFRERGAEVRIGEDDLGGVEFRQHHRRLDALALDHRDDALAVRSATTSNTLVDVMMTSRA